MIAFVQDDDLMVVPVDGSAPPRPLTQGARAAGAPGPLNSGFPLNPPTRPLTSPLLSRDC